MKITKARISGGFWKKRQDLIENRIIWEQLEILKGRKDGLQPDEYSYVVDNFRIAAGELNDPYHGFVYSDSELGKWIEAAAYCLRHNPNKRLEEEVDSLVDLICRAQMDDGYINTYFQVLRPSSRLKHFAFSCELYNIGHLMEASATYFEVTGKTKFLNSMCRAADLLCKLIGPDPGQFHIYDGHAEIELGLLKLFNVTGNVRYRDLAKYFVDERGKQPCFFLTEELLGDNDTGANDKWFGPDHHQAHKPVREQSEADGHSVKVTYLYSAATELFLNGADKDGSLFQAADRVWKNMVTHRLYITGAIGSHGYAERFSVDDDLPPDRSYAETCASVGICFWGKRMLRAHHRAEIYDVMEKAMYNGILSGLSLDGQRYFYVNMLHCKHSVTDYREDEKFVITKRSKWFKCACCPSNILRVLENIEEYLFSAEDNTFYIDGYATSDIDLSHDNKKITLHINTDYPYNGNVKIKVNANAEPFTISLRVPGWCSNYSLQINGNMLNQVKNDEGYIVINRIWDVNDTILFQMDMPARYITSNPKVWDTWGKAAVVRGPIVYCLEALEGEETLSGISFNSLSDFAPVMNCDDMFGETILEGSAFQEGDNGILYNEYSISSRSETKIKLIPYFTWGNRGRSDMDVFLPIR